MLTVDIMMAKLLPASIVAHVRAADDKVAVRSQVIQSNVDTCGWGPCHMRCSVLQVADADWSFAYSFGHKALWAVRYADKGIPSA